MPLGRFAALLLAFALLPCAASFGAPATSIAQGSDEELRAAKHEVDALSNISDDRKRIAGAQAFLKKYPGNYWRHLGYRLWLFSAWRAGDLAELQKAADAYVKEYPNSGAAYGSVSRYLYEAHVLQARGYESGVKAKQLFESELGTDGSLESMREVNERTAGIAAQPQWKPPTQRAVFINYLGSRFNLARYELQRNQRKLALELLEPVIELEPFTQDEDETLAPFYFVQGQAYESLGNAQHAYRAYLSALIVGDSSNRYASQAQSRLQVVGDKAGKEAREQVLRSLVPQELAKTPLVRFTDVTQVAGLTGIKGSRAAWGDVDNDNDADLLLDGSTLLLNNGSEFVDSSADWGLTSQRNAGLFADADNDGDLDIFTLGDGSRENRLLLNDAKSFEDASTATGSSTPAPASTAGAWLDFDRDGWVDFFVAGMNEVTRILAERSKEPAADVLLRNERGTLRETAAGMGSEKAKPAAGAGAAAADGDGDGDIDLFVANREGPSSYMWTNKGGSFENLASDLGIVGESKGRSAASTGADWGDVDNDGDLDLFVCNWSTPDERYGYLGSAFYMQDADVFHDVRESRGIRGTALTEPLLADFNNDGWLDLYVTSSGSGQRSFLYVNDGKGGWHDMTYLSSARVLGGQGSAAADFDRDGDLDLLVCTGGGVRLLRNDTTKQNWLQVSVKGGMGYDHADDGKVWSNAAGIGTRVTLSMGTEKFTREIESGKGSGCGNELIAQFGLGARRGRMTITVRFPSGREVTRALVDSQQRYEIRETDAAQPQRPQQPPAPPTRSIGH
jgi:tetratricopeptide (TPR) repeat protein